MEIPGYKIIDTLGEGGMAKVFLAIQESFEREVALKVMSPNLASDPSFGERFLREARIVSRLIHPNIVTVYDVGVHDGHHFLSMEYIPGRDLKHKRLELKLSERLQVIKEIARALDYAGKKGYVHRDVKPENIMLHEENGRAVLMDFGIARPSEVSSGMTQTGMAIGTPYYMSPEQAIGKVVDSRSDIYSLGVVLFQLLTGYVPFYADSAVAIGIKHISEDIPPLPKHLQVFKAIIDKAMAKLPEERYQTASGLIADLDAIPAADIAAAEEASQSVVLPPEASEQGPTVVTPAATMGTPVATRANETPAAPTRPAVNSKTAVRSTQAAATLVQPAATIIKPIKPAPIVATLEDRQGHLKPEQTRKSGGGWLGLVIVLGLAGGAWGAWTNKWLDPWLPESLVSGDKSVPAPVETTPAVATPAPEQSAKPVVEKPVPDKPALDKSVTDKPVDKPLNAETVAQEAGPDWAAKVDRLLPGALDKPEELTELVGIYRDMQASTDPGWQEKGSQGLTSVQQHLATKLSTAVDADDKDAAVAIKHQIDTHFAGENLPPSLQEDLDRLAKMQSLDERLAQAKNYIAQGALSSPAGANALEIYRQILAEQPDHADANAGVAAILTRYGELAEKQAAAAKPEAALQLVRQGLQIDPAHVRLKKQEQDYLAAIQADKNVQALLSKARAQESQNKLLEPAGDNAFDTLQMLLRDYPQRKDAKGALATLEASVVKQLNNLVSQDALEEAESLLAKARERFTHSEALLEQSIKIEEAYNLRRPSVDRVLISGQELTSIDGEQPSSFSADRVIYIGFNYRRLKEETAVIQAILYEGSRSLQIAQTAVIISGESGTQFFRFERPVTGFPEGGYSIDFVLGENLLKTVAFRVKN